jgi:TrmH family RNA methyltransferase
MPEFSVILVEPLYQRNMGSVARVMKNFNFRELVLVNPPEITMEAIAMSMHARDVLESAKIVKDFDDLRRDFDFLVATSAIVASDSNPLRTPIFPEQLVSSEGLKGKIGIVFGREDKGLSNDELKKCDLFVTIPAHHEYPTLNVAQSAAVILYEIYKFSKLKNFELSGEIPLKKTRKAGKIEKDVLLQKFDELVDSVDLRDFKADIAKKTFRTIIGRGFISGREAFTLIGVFRRAHKAIKTKI